MILLTSVTLQLSLGDNVTMRFSLSNDDPPVQTEDIRWFFVVGGSRTDITNSSDNRHTLFPDRLSLLIDGITHFDEGEYVLEATNAAGTGSNSVILSVTGKQPNMQTMQIPVCTTCDTVVPFISYHRCSSYYRWSRE